MESTAQITTVIGQLYIERGTWDDKAPNQIAVREPKSTEAPGFGKGDLFVLTEVIGDIDRLSTLELRLAETVRDAYYMSRGSITASLRRAIQTANDQLYQRNYNAAVEERVVGGVAALVMTQEDVFVAQAGPAAFFAISGERVERYPAQSVWLDEVVDLPNDAEDPALGISSFVEPKLYHVQVSPADVLVLADSQLVSELGPNSVAKAVYQQNIRAAIKNLSNAVDNRDCSALTLCVVEGDATSFGGLSLPDASHLSKLLPQRADSGAGQPKPVESLPDGTPMPVSATATGASPLHRLAPLMQKSMGWLGKSSKKERQPAQTTPPKKQPLNSGVVMASAARDPAFDPQLKQGDSAAQFISNLGRSAGGMAVMAFATLAGGLKSMSNSSDTLEPEFYSRQAGRQAYPRQASPIPWKLLLALAIAIPFVVGAVVGISYLRNQRLQETEYNNLLQTAQTKFEQIDTVDAGSAIGLITEAENLLLQAEKIKPGQPEVTALRQEMAVETDRIGKVERLAYLPQLRRYTDPGTNLSSVLVQGIDVYVLDTGTNRIFHHQINPSGEGLLPDDESVLLLQQGQVVEDITVGNLVDMVWMPSGGNRQTSDLVVLNNSGLLEYNPSWGLTTASLAAREALVRPTAVDSFFGNFYVLDSQANTILRYLPTTDGYGAIPEHYFPPDQPIDLVLAVDFAIDGAIYVLFQDGRISKFASGRPTTFSLNGLDRPLQNPSAIFTAPDEIMQYIYVADTGNQRIVQFDKEGTFIRQLKPQISEAATFANLQDIYVDEIGERLYVLDSNNFYLGVLPPLAP